MGGYGSGRRLQLSKYTTSDMLILDVRKLQREGWLKPGYFHSLYWNRNGQKTADIKMFTGTDFVSLSYRTRKNGGEWKDKDYDVTIERTPCNYGGYRVWFLCPNCSRRVAKLYGGEMFYCRHCHNLTYDSQREGELDRLTRKGNKIRDRLGWEPGMLNGYGWKPKGMHWKTFNRLEAQHNQIAEILHNEIMAYLDGL